MRQTRRVYRRSFPRPPATRGSLCEQDRGRETFKAIITTDETDFSWLQQSGTRSVGLPSQLQQMMERACEGEKTRDVVMTAAAPMEDWLTINRSFELRKA